MSPTPARVAGTMAARAYFSAAAGGAATVVPGCSMLSPSKELDTTTNSQLASKIDAVGSTIESSIQNSIQTVSNELWPYVVLGIIVVVILAGVLVLVLIGAFWLLRKWIEKNSYLNQKPVWLREQAKGYPTLGAESRPAGRTSSPRSPDSKVET